MSLSFCSLLKRMTTPAPKKKTAAAFAKERLQIIVSHEHMKSKTPDFVQGLQKELLAVLSKYVKIDPDTVQVNLQRRGEHSVLELNITLGQTEEISS
jgi:cell division topological specificity factor